MVSAIQSILSAPRAPVPDFLTWQPHAPSALSEEKEIPAKNKSRPDEKSQSDDNDSHNTHLNLILNELCEILGEDASKLSEGKIQELLYANIAEMSRIEGPSRNAGKQRKYVLPIISQLLKESLKRRSTFKATNSSSVVQSISNDEELDLSAIAAKPGSTSVGSTSQAAFAQDSVLESSRSFNHQVEVKFEHYVSHPNFDAAAVQHAPAFGGSVEDAAPDSSSCSKLTWTPAQVGNWLRKELGLDGVASVLLASEIGGSKLLEMTEADLIQLGLPALQARYVLRSLSGSEDEGPACGIKRPRQQITSSIEESNTPPSRPCAENFNVSASLSARSPRTSSCPLSRQAPANNSMEVHITSFYLIGCLFVSCSFYLCSNSIYYDITCLSIFCNSLFCCFFQSRLSIFYFRFTI